MSLGLAKSAACTPRAAPPLLLVIMNPREEPPEKLTLHQAADALNASTTHVKELLGQGLIAHHGEGARLRIDQGSLLAYKARDDQERQAVLDELVRDSQEQGHGY